MALHSDIGAFLGVIWALQPVFLSCPRIKEIDRPQISIQWWLLSEYQTKEAAKNSGLYRECCEDKNPLYGVGPRPPVPRPRVCVAAVYWPPGPALDHIADILTILSLDTQPESPSPGMTTLNKELRHPVTLIVCGDITCVMLTCADMCSHGTCFLSHQTASPGLGLVRVSVLSGLMTNAF